jgi:hypothetical protein
VYKHEGLQFLKEILRGRKNHFFGKKIKQNEGVENDNSNGKLKLLNAAHLFIIIRSAESV